MSGGSVTGFGDLEIEDRVTGAVVRRRLEQGSAWVRFSADGRQLFVDTYLGSSYTWDVTTGTWHHDGSRAGDSSLSTAAVTAGGAVVSAYFGSDVVVGPAAGESTAPKRLSSLRGAVAADTGAVGSGAGQLWILVWGSFTMPAACSSATRGGAMSSALNDPINGDVLVLTPTGEIDMSVAHRLQADWVDAALRARAQRIIVDFGGVTFVDSSGVAALVVLRRTQQDLGGDVAISSPSPMLLKLLRLTGLSEVFPIVPRIRTIGLAPMAGAVDAPGG